MTDVYDWRDLSATAVAEPDDYWVSWTVYEQTAWTSAESDARPFYPRAGADNGMDVVEVLDQAQPWIRTRIKWDGCSELELPDPDGTHICGWPAAQNLHAVHTRLFEMTAWYLGERDDAHELPAARYTPTHLPVVDGDVPDDTDMTQEEFRAAASGGEPVTIVATREEYEAALSEPTREAWSELRLTGQPPGAGSYDVTVRSDTYDTNGARRWTQLANVARLALGLREGHAWADVTVHRRYIETTRRETGWVEMSDAELTRAGHGEADGTSEGG